MWCPLRRYRNRDKLAFCSESRVGRPLTARRLHPTLSSMLFVCIRELSTIFGETVNGRD